jgi:hypothetical protein
VLGRTPGPAMLGVRAEAEEEEQASPMLTHRAAPAKVEEEQEGQEEEAKDEDHSDAGVPVLRRGRQVLSDDDENQDTAGEGQSQETAIVVNESPEPGSRSPVAEDSPAIGVRPVRTSFERSRRRLVRSPESDDEAPAPERSGSNTTWSPAAEAPENDDGEEFPDTQIGAMRTVLDEESNAFEETQAQDLVEEHESDDDLCVASPPYEHEEVDGDASSVSNPCEEQEGGNGAEPKEEPADGEPMQKCSLRRDEDVDDFRVSPDAARPQHMDCASPQQIDSPAAPAHDESTASPAAAFYSPCESPHVIASPAAPQAPASSPTASPAASLAARAVRRVGFDDAVASSPEMPRMSFVSVRRRSRRSHFASAEDKENPTSPLAAILPRPVAEESPQCNAKAMESPSRYLP